MGVIMKEKLEKQLRAFLVGMSVPVLFSSGCIKFPRGAKVVSPLHLEQLNTDTLRNKFFEYCFISNNGEDVTASLFSDEEIARVINCSETTSECSYEWDGDVENLKDTIKENSILFLEEHDEFESAFCDYESDYDLFHTQVKFEAIFDRVIDDFVSHTDENMNEDICKFQTLSIVFGEIENNSSTMGYYQVDTNSIVLCYQSIMEACQYTNDTPSDFFTHILSHELNHARQLICEDRLQKGQQYQDVCYKDDVLSFIIESSAESALYNVDDASFEDEMYPDERKYEALFFLFAICNEKADIQDYYDAIFDVNLEELYQFLGCDTEDDIYTFYRILSSIDASLGRDSDLVDLDSSIQTVGDAERFIGYRYKINLFTHILADMVDYTSRNSSFSLEENLALFKIVRTVLSADSYTLSRNDDGELERVYDLEFVSSFKNFEDMYYMFLSSFYQVDVLELERIEENYTNDIMDAVNTFCVDDKSTYKDMPSLLERFPLLEPIFKAVDVSSYDYERFVENNENVYTKKK